MAGNFLTSLTTISFWRSTS